ncbi:hypothetical protein QUB60_19335 [Microcoleus sp. A2-C5]|uniref:hypothetical protein n=1 Tax=Microcoleaceae TaxID=1892252 RepID=UPI0022373D18|nr:hypothetical protein [Lyngbya sp. CCAP 1446/10]
MDSLFSAPLPSPTKNFSHQLDPAAKKQGDGPIVQDVSYQEYFLWEIARQHPKLKISTGNC